MRMQSADSEKWTYAELRSAARGIGAAGAFLLLAIGLAFFMPWSIWAAGPNGWRAMSELPLPEEVWGAIFILIGGAQIWAQSSKSLRHLRTRRWLLPINGICFGLLLWMAILSNPWGLLPWLWGGVVLLDIWSAGFLYLQGDL